MKKQTIKIKTNEENPEPVEIIAQSIIEVSDAFKKIQDSRLTQRAIILLIHDKCPAIGKRQIEIILDIVPKLKDYFVKDLPKKKRKS